MVNLSTQYMGLKLKNPLIAGSSGLTNSIEHLKEIEKNGAGAIVLKSIFEEQIKIETHKLLNSEKDIVKDWKKTFENIISQNDYHYAEALEYINNFATDHTLNDYLKFVTEAKKSVSIPIIASINCVSVYDWMYFAKKIQDTGVDALELNVYLLPSDFKATADYNEKVILGIIAEVKKYITIPFAVKIGFYFSSLAASVKKISESGVSAVVLFNRPFNPDIDINNFEFTANTIYSNVSEFSHTLRWTGILSGRIDCEISASTGIHDYTSVAKMLLAGAETVQMASVLYQKGFSEIKKIISDLEMWMEKNKFSSISDFRGRMSMRNINDPAAYERVQFMKHYSKIE